MNAGVDDALIQEMLDDLVVRGSDDWVMLTEVDWVVKSNASRHGLDLDVPARITVGIEVLRRALGSELMVAGDVIDEPQGFVPWGVDSSVALERIESGWRVAGDGLQMGDVGWLANTPEGSRLAEGVLDEVNARADWPPSDD